jgi:hypothetical protein
MLAPLLTNTTILFPPEEFIDRAGPPLPPLIVADVPPDPEAP